MSSIYENIDHHQFVRDNQPEKIQFRSITNHPWGTFAANHKFVNKRDENGKTAMELAIDADNVECVKALSLGMLADNSIEYTMEQKKYYLLRYICNTHERKRTVRRTQNQEAIGHLDYEFCVIS